MGFISFTLLDVVLCGFISTEMQYNGRQNRMNPFDVFGTHPNQTKRLTTYIYHGENQIKHFESTDHGLSPRLVVSNTTEPL
jgi:hypothetical protein